MKKGIESLTAAVNERTEEEVERMAEEKIPLYPIYADLLDNLKWDIYILHLRKQWIDGYKEGQTNHQ